MWLVPICPPVCAKGAVWTVGYGERACCGLQTTKGDISPARRCNGMQKKTSKVVGVLWMGILGRLS